MSAIEQPAAGSSGSNALKFIGCGCLALIVIGILGVGGMSYAVISFIKNSDPYRESMAAVEANPAAVEALGTPITPGFFLSGSGSTTNGVGAADFSIPVSGPKGKGSIRIVGSKEANATHWTYETWELQLPDGRAIPLSK